MSLARVRDPISFFLPKKHHTMTFQFSPSGYRGLLTEVRSVPTNSSILEVAILDPGTMRLLERNKRDRRRTRLCQAMRVPYHSEKLPSEADANFSDIHSVEI